MPTSTSVLQLLSLKLQRADFSNPHVTAKTSLWFYTMQHMYIQIEIYVSKLFSIAFKVVN